MNPLSNSIKVSIFHSRAELNRILTTLTCLSMRWRKASRSQVSVLRTKWVGNSASRECDFQGKIGSGKQATRYTVRSRGAAYFAPTSGLIFSPVLDDKVRDSLKLAHIVRDKDGAQRQGVSGD